MSFNDEVRRFRNSNDTAIRKAKEETWCPILGRYVDIIWQGEGDYAFFENYESPASDYGVYWCIGKISSYEIGRSAHVGYFKECDREEMTRRTQHLIDYEASKNPDKLGFRISRGRWRDEMKRAKKQGNLKNGTSCGDEYRDSGMMGNSDDGSMAGWKPAGPWDYNRDPNYHSQH